MRNPSRIEWLDLFRGVAAIVVVVYHYRGFLSVRPSLYAFIAVDFFFVLSGIVLAMRYAEAIEGGLSLRQFASARLKRLYPMVLIAGVFAAAVMMANAPAGHALDALQNRSVWSVFILRPELDVARISMFPADGPLWSLLAELAANLVWFLALRTGRWTMIWLATFTMFITVGAAWRAGSVDVGATAGYVSLGLGVARALAWFCVGYAIATGVFRRFMDARTMLLLAGAVTMACTVAFHRPWLNQLCLIATGAALLQVLLAAPPPSAAIATVARLLGQASYPLYLIHMPCQRLMGYVHFLPRVVAMVLVLTACTIIATALNEQLVSLVQRVGRRRKPAAPAGASLAA